MISSNTHHENGKFGKFENENLKIEKKIKNENFKWKIGKWKSWKIRKIKKLNIEKNEKRDKK